MNEWYPDQPHSNPHRCSYCETAKACGEHDMMCDCKCHKEPEEKDQRVSVPNYFQQSEAGFKAAQRILDAARVAGHEVFQDMIIHRDTDKPR